ncbi:hypothetical protein [Bacteroides thetaiotaomicron]|uniref:hypothetical protein n=1 Tax=Bacteroides thetaiotaomicron TaxID=818 RepID=UPI00356685BD
MNDEIAYTVESARKDFNKALSFRTVIELIQDAANNGKVGTSVHIRDEEYVDELEKRGFLVSKTVDPELFNVFWIYDDKQKSLIEKHNKK